MAKILFIEGMDRTGKDTLIDALVKQIGFDHLYLRGFVSNIAYAISYERDEKLIEGYLDLFNKMHEALGDDMVSIVLQADNRTLQARIEATNHEPVNLARDRTSFKRAIAMLKSEQPDHRIVELDSACNSPEMLAKLVTDMIGDSQ